MKPRALRRLLVLRRHRSASRIYALLAQAAILGLVLSLALVNKGGISWLDQSGAETAVSSPRQLSERPDNVFSKEQMSHGAFFLFIACLLYMFLGIAMVCDDYFVAALEVIVDRFKIQDDVAGATFMAAGGSAPEFATSLMGVFFFSSDVGFGTIVGSAVFNILFVIGLCAYFSGFATMQLTWYPLVRDSSFYCICLAILFGFVVDNKVEWWEALVMFFLYVIYVLIMYFDVKIRAAVMSFEAKHIRLSTAGTRGELSAAASNRTSTGSGALQTPLGGSSAKVHPADTPPGSQHSRDSWPTQESVDAGLGAQCKTQDAVDPEKGKEVPAEGKDLVEPAELPATDPTLLEVDDVENGMPHAALKPQSDAAPPSAAPPAEVKEGALKADKVSDGERGSGGRTVHVAYANGEAVTPAPGGGESDGGGGGEEEEERTSCWPEIPEGGVWPWLKFLICAPLAYSFALTIPDCRIESRKKYYGLTMVMSLVWITLLSYVMVWMAEELGDLIGLPASIMGVTVLAAGTSIPDAISSVLVAREGHGDMALSSSIGSNVFDVTFGLPIPWLLATLIADPGSSISIGSKSLPLQVGTLLTMVVVVVVSIHCFNWQISKPLGITYFLLYFCFVAEAILLELCIIPCFSIS